MPALELVLQYLVAGLTYGTIYAVVGVGFNIIYNATGIINFAQGEFVMLGGMTAVTLHRFVPLPARHRRRRRSSRWRSARSSSWPSSAGS